MHSKLGATSQNDNEYQWMIAVLFVAITTLLVHVAFYVGVVADIVVAPEV